MTKVLFSVSFLFSLYYINGQDRKLKNEFALQRVENEKKLDTLKKEINKIKSEISRCKQFNKKVELNISLQKLENNLKDFTNSF